MAENQPRLAQSVDKPICNGTLSTKLFQTFREASAYAKTLARELAPGVRLKRVGANWEVDSPNHPRGLDSKIREKIIAEREREQEERKRQQKKIREQIIAERERDELEKYQERKRQQEKSWQKVLAERERKKQRNLIDREYLRKKLAQLAEVLASMVAATSVWDRGGLRMRLKTHRQAGFCVYGDNSMEKRLMF